MTNQKNYAREWRENNKERVAEYRKKWKDSHKERTNEYQKKWTETHREHVNEYRREYYKKKEKPKRDIMRKIKEDKKIEDLISFIYSKDNGY